MNAAVGATVVASTDLAEVLDGLTELDDTCALLETMALLELDHAPHEELETAAGVDAVVVMTAGVEEVVQTAHEEAVVLTTATGVVTGAAEDDQTPHEELAAVG